jgi:imidazolonepropionase-like amidohydrolase
MNKTIIFKNAFLIDGNGGEPSEDVILVVSDGIIRERIPDAKDTKVPKGWVIDLKGKTLMPGLIDAHVHPGNIELTLKETAVLPPAVYVHRATMNLEKDLMLGFTTLRDAAGLDAGFKVAIDQGLIRGPRLFLSVSPLTQTSGNTDYGRISRVDPMPRNSIGVFPEICDGQDEVRKAARRVLGRGADHIKIFADGEVASQTESDKAKPGQWKFTIDEIRASVETAEAFGTYVMAHAYGPRAIQNCVAAGVRSIEHGNLMDVETTKLMYEQEVYYVPTLTTYDVLSKEARGQLDSYTIEKLTTVLQKGICALELAYRTGVKIGSGSDIIGPFQHLKGRELALKAEVMTPMEVIVSSTRTNAELIGIDDQLGTLESGKIADLIVIDGNPLEDLKLFEHGLERIVLVMKGGKIVKNIIKSY